MKNLLVVCNASFPLLIKAIIVWPHPANHDQARLLHARQLEFLFSFLSLFFYFFSICRRGWLFYKRNRRDWFLLTFILLINKKKLQKKEKNEENKIKERDKKTGHYWRFRSQALMSEVQLFLALWQPMQTLFWTFFTFPNLWVLVIE
jgi:hypothetical protein